MNGSSGNRPWPAVRASAFAVLISAASVFSGGAAGQSVPLDTDARSAEQEVSAPGLSVPDHLWAPPDPRPGFLPELEFYVSVPALTPPAPRPAFLSAREGLASAPASVPYQGGRRYVQEPASTREIISRAGVSGITGAILFDLSNGALLDAHARHISLPPASTIKIATGAWALEVLGPLHRFETRVVATGPVVDGRVQGDLALQGTGDPALDNRGLAALVDALARAGIRGVDGRFIFDETALPGGPWIDPGQRDGEASNTGYGALNLNYNRVRLESEFLENGTIDIRVLADADELSVPVDHITVKVGARVEAGRNGMLQHRSAADGESWEIDVHSLRDNPVRWLPVRDPGLYAASVFRDLAQARGLALPAPERAGTTVTGARLAVHRGRPLVELVSGMLDFSNNLTAEVLGLSAAAASGVVAWDLREGAERLAAWVGSDFAAYNRLVDHSGLGDQARITPSAFQSILVRSVVLAGTSDADIRSILPVRSLESSDSGSPLPPAMIQAKTGTLYYVRGLVGYMRLGNGTARELGFAIFSADLPTRRRMRVGRFDSGPPPGVEDARQWRKQAVELESEILRNWIRAFS